MPDLREQLANTLSGSYTLERELGGGGMSRVFVADERALGRKVVVKVLSPELAAGVSAERFTREVKLAARLQHANIVPVLAAGESGSLPFYTMPFVEGQSLRTRLKDGALSVPEVITILRDVVRALAYAHEHGVVHRDIKPDNVLLSGGAAVVTDFGIAKAISAARADENSTVAPTLTQIGTSLGTPAYMAPEQVAGDPNTDYRADIYSLGAMAYELLAGRPPFVERDARRLLTAQMSVRPQPISELRPDTPASLAELVMNALEKDPAARPDSASAILRALDTVTSGGGLPVMPPILIGGQGMLKKALLLYGAAFLLVAILAQAAIIAIGLPDWVLPGAVGVMLLGLPVLLFTAYVHRVVRQAYTMTPTYTPGGSPSIPQGTMATVALKASPHVSWRRTALGGVIAVGVFTTLVVVFMVLRVLGIGPVGSLFAAGKLSRDEPLLVADFGVRGSADSSLGGVVSEAIRTDLSQSDVLLIVSPATVRDALQRMQRPARSRLDIALAREVAQREGIKAIIDGDLTPLGAGFVVTTRLIAAETGDELASFREVADAPKDLIPAVGRLSRNLRGKIGESLKNVRATPRLEAVSTPSLEALRKYADGSRAVDVEVDHQKAIELLKEAVAIDSTFAMAWRKLSVAYFNSGLGGDAGDSAVTRAYRYRDRLTEQERYAVVAYYYGSGPGRDRAKAAQAYEALLAKGHGDVALNNVGLIYNSRREFAKAESVFARRAAMPGAPYVAFSNLVFALFQQGKIAAAESVSAVAAEQFPTAPGVATRGFAFMYHRGQVDSLRATASALRFHRNPQVRATALFTLATLERLHGRLSAAAALAQEARSVQAARGVSIDSLQFALDTVYGDIWYRDEGRRGSARLDAVLERTPLQTLPPSRRPYFWLAILYANAGQPEKARGILAQYDRDVRDTTMRRDEAPGRHAAMAQIALAEGRHRDAVREFRASSVLPDGPAGGCGICESVALGRVFELAAMPDSAIVHYEAFLAGTQMGRFGLDAGWKALTLRRLGEMYERKGDRAKAVEYYRSFVQLWNNADPDLQSRVAEVRRRIARLRDVERP